MFTVYDTENNEFTKVEEPDPSLSYTYAEYLKWNFEERLELFRGKLFTMSPAPPPIHQQQLSTLNGLFYIAFKNKNCKIYPAPFDIRLPVKNKKKDNEIMTVVQPGISVICDETKIDDRGCCGAPDLVIEILSPGNSKKEIKLKHELYEEAGVAECWVVFPPEETIIVFLLNEDHKYRGRLAYAANDTIYSKAFPGFSINLNDVFTK